MKYRLIVAILGTCLMVGCATEAAPTLQRYILPSVDSVSAFDEHAAPQQLQLAAIRMPAYLQDVPMVLIKDNGEVMQANYHQWAEPLPQQLVKLTLMRLRQRLPQMQWYSSYQGVTNSERLTIDVDAFQANLHGMISVSGRWQLWSAEGKLQQQAPFSYSAQQPQDGYPSMTQTLANCWVNDVVDGIAKSLPH